MNPALVISGVCGLASIILVLGLVFSGRFRRDVLGGQGEATVAGGLVTTKGAAIIVLCGLFLAGMMYPLFQSAQPNPSCASAVGALSAQLEEKFSSEVTYAASQPNTKKLEGIIERLKQSAKAITDTCH